MAGSIEDIDYTNISIDALTFTTGEDGQPGSKGATSFDNEIEKLSSRVEQFHWIVSWLEKHKMLKTLDTLLEEGADIASESFNMAKNVEVVEEKDDYAKEKVQSWDPHSGQNILSTKFHPNSSLDVIATGSTDRTAALSNWKTGEKLVTIYGAHTAAVLCLDWHPTAEGRLIMGSVDNTASVVDVKGLAGPKEGITYQVLARLPIHKKHVVRVAWSVDGKRFATASYDHFIKIVEEKLKDDGEVTYEVIKAFELAEAVESVVWTPDGKWLIASARKDNYLHYYSTDTWTETKFNMNAVQADDHVSFTAMDLHLSHDGKHLLVATDKNRVIMFATGTPLQVRNFYDIPNGEWCTPRTAFNQSGDYVYVTSEDKTIFIFSVATSAKKHVLSGHTSNIRDLATHPSLEIIASGSFDKSLKIWA